jgi:hypothetical protein
MPSLDINSLSDKINAAVMQGSGTDTNALATGINSALTNWFRTNLFPLMVGVSVFITVLFVFYGSFLYFTAYGDENRATQAKKTITYAFVGFFIAAVALGIANYSKRILISKSYEDCIIAGKTDCTGSQQGPAAGTGGSNLAPVNNSNGTGIVAPDINSEPNNNYQGLPGQ